MWQLDVKLLQTLFGADFQCVRGHDRSSTRYRLLPLPYVRATVHAQYLASHSVSLGQIEHGLGDIPGRCNLSLRRQGTEEVLRNTLEQRCIHDARCHDVEAYTLLRILQREA